MKKIFTLISVALCAMSVNAQTQTKTFSVSNGDFTTDKHWQFIQVVDGEKAVANFEILSSRCSIRNAIIIQPQHYNNPLCAMLYLPFLQMKLILL